MKTPPKTATPPAKGTGVEWIFRCPGSSINPLAAQKERHPGKLKKVTPKAVPKATRYSHKKLIQGVVSLRQDMAPDKNQTVDIRTPP